MTFGTPPFIGLRSEQRLDQRVRGSAPLLFPAWPVAALSIPILLRALLFTSALVTEPWSADPERWTPAWAQLFEAALFGAVAFILIHYGRGDRRAWALGLLLVDVAATLLTPFVLAIATPSALTWFALRLRTDAFQAALVWFFASVFPHAHARPGLARAFFAGTTASFLLGLLLVLVDTYAQLAGESGPTTLRLAAAALRRESPGAADWYFTLQFLLLSPLFIALPLKLRESGPNDRRRFMWLVIGLTIGFLPLAVVVLGVTLLPTEWVSQAAPWFSLLGTVVLLALTAIPIAGAYAALVQRTLNVRLVLRSALQYVLARSFLRALVAIPFVGFVILVALNRERPVIELLQGPRAVILGLLTLGGVAATIGHRRVQAWIDRRFFRHQIDARATLLAVAAGVREASSLDEFRQTLLQALDEAFHPVSLASAVAGSDDQLHSLDADVTPLPRGSALAQLLSGSDRPLELEGDGASLLNRLSRREQEWLAAARAMVLVPLRGSSGALLGLIALGEKRSELPYTDEDISLLTSVGTASGLALDRILAPSREQTPPGLLPDPAARECIECGSVFDHEATVCTCGGLLQRAAVPRLLGDRLGFAQRIGSGGMGVVYRAVDLRLQQLRAVKTLPVTDAVMVSRMRREARAMASTRHLHLATLHGLESWRGAPMLVMEYLEGGTLADRLKRGPVPLGEAVALGLRIAEALVVLHGSGILHRDIKPSNIGFAADGTPKLLDFGLAKLVGAVAPQATAGWLVDDTTWTTGGETGALGLRGTPAYLSPWVLTAEAPAPRDDCWSLSVSLLEACAGVNPFRAPTMAETVARVLTEIHRVGDVCATLTPAGQSLFTDLLLSTTDRPTTAEQLIVRLRSCPLY